MAAALAVMGLAASCGSSGGRPDEELAGLVKPERREQPPIDLDRAATDAAELRRAAMQPHRALAAGLGAHTFKGTSSVVVTENGTTVRELTDETSLEYRDDGQYHALLANSKDYGREIYFLDGTLYLASRHQKFSKRAPADEGEPARLADEIAGALAANLDLVAHAAEVSDRGVQQVAGRSARTIVFKLAPGEQKPPTEVLPQRAWRQSIAVSALQGQISLDAETGVVLAGTLDATLGFSRDGRRFQMVVAVTHAIADIGAPRAIEPPAEERVVVVAEHHREAMEREDLLRGIAPPARKAPTPGDTAGTASP
ncbi:MAG TPA: hypothetical protein VML75_05305 [Kofleriaceae bacterium]|nr:hypothetical protein [Kofleriaceae bacterium]